MTIPNNLEYRGDTIALEYTLWTDKSSNLPWVLTNYQIRFQLNTATPIKKATANVSGGSDSQINITDAVNGDFVVLIPKTETANLVAGDYDFEIEVTAPAPTYAKTTVLQGVMRIKADLITWESI